MPGSASRRPGRRRRLGESEHFSRGGDPHKLFLLGHSSGATLAALVGLDQRYLKRQGLNLSALRGVVPMGSIMWDDELDRALKQYGRARVEEGFLRDPDNKMYGTMEAYLDHGPIRHIHKGLPPYLFLIVRESHEHQDECCYYPY